jgi:hypothetical protein
MTYNTIAIAITPSLVLRHRSEVAAPAISTKDRIAMSAEATRQLAVGFLLIGPPCERPGALQVRELLKTWIGFERRTAWLGW